VLNLPLNIIEKMGVIPEKHGIEGPIYMEKIIDCICEISCKRK
jgi:hypothetical protein